MHEAEKREKRRSPYVLQNEADCFSQSGSSDRRTSSSLDENGTGVKLCNFVRFIKAVRTFSPPCGCCTPCQNR